MGNVCGSHSVKDSGSSGAVAAVAKVKATTNGGSAKHDAGQLPTIAADATNGGSSDVADSNHQREQQQDTSSHRRKSAQQDQQFACGSVQAVKGEEPSSISIKVAPAPPPDDYPEIKAAVAAAQKEVKAGAKLKFANLYTLGAVIGTGHYAR